MSPCLSESQKEILKQEYAQWLKLEEAICDLYYIALTKPDWYQGSIGRETFYADRIIIDSLHVAMSDLTPDSISALHYIYIDCAKDLLIQSLKGTIERQLPDSLDNFHSQEQKEEMLCYRNEAIEQLNMISKELLDNWIDTRDSFADSRTSQFLCCLSEIISLP